MNPNAGEHYFLKPISLCPTNNSNARSQLLSEWAPYLSAQHPEYKKIQRRLDMWSYTLYSVIKSQTDLINDMITYTNTWAYPPDLSLVNVLHHNVGVGFRVRIKHEKSLWLALMEYLHSTIQYSRNLLHTMVQKK